MAEETKYKYKDLSNPIEGEVELWKIARLGFILNELQKKYDNLDMNGLITLLFLSHFHYSDPEFVHFNTVTGKHKLYFVKITLNKLARTNLVDKVDLTLDRELRKIYPEHVYQLTTTGRKLVDKIHYYMDGTGNFLSFSM